MPTRTRSSSPWPTPSRTVSTRACRPSRVGRSPETAARVDVPKDRQYVGFDAYKNVIDQVDVVLLTTPPHFRPLHMAYAVEKGSARVRREAGRHRRAGRPRLPEVVRGGQEEEPGGRSRVSAGVHSTRGARLMKRVLDGMRSATSSRSRRPTTRAGVWDPRKSRGEVSSEMEYQMRNWYYYTWLSGDHIVEQAVHGIDTMAWALGDSRRSSAGARRPPGPHRPEVRQHLRPLLGRLRIPQQRPRLPQLPPLGGTPHQQIKDYVLGVEGILPTSSAAKYPGASDHGQGRQGPRRSDVAKNNMYQTEHDELFASIRAGKPINNGEYAASSTLLAIMARMAAYTGQVITWEMAMNSKEAGPRGIRVGRCSAAPVARPGVTKFV